MTYKMTSSRAEYNRADMETAVSLTTGMGRDKAAEAVGAVITGIICALVGGSMIALDGIGTFRVVGRAPRKGKANGKEWTAPKRTAVKFVPDMALVEVLDPEWAALRRKRARDRYLKRTRPTAAVGAPPAANACPATVGDEGPPAWLAAKRAKRP